VSNIKQQCNSRAKSKSVGTFIFDGDTPGKNCLPKNVIWFTSHQILISW